MAAGVTDTEEASESRGGPDEYEVEDLLNGAVTLTAPGALALDVEADDGRAVLIILLDRIYEDRFEKRRKGLAVADNRSARRCISCTSCASESRRCVHKNMRQYYT